MFPMVPLGSNLNLGLAIVSYSGTLNFGLVGDFNAGHRRSSRSDVRDPCFVVRQTRRPGRLFPRIARKARLSGRSHSSPTARTARDCIGDESVTCTSLAVESPSGRGGLLSRSPGKART